MSQRPTPPRSALPRGPEAVINPETTPAPTLPKTGKTRSAVIPAKPVKPDHPAKPVIPAVPEHRERYTSSRPGSTRNSSDGARRHTCTHC